MKAEKEDPKVFNIDGDKFAAYLDKAGKINELERRRAVEQREVERLFKTMFLGYYEELEQNMDNSKMTFTFRAVIQRFGAGPSKVKAVAAVKPLPIGGELDGTTDDPDQDVMRFENEEELQ